MLSLSFFCVLCFYFGNFISLWIFFVPGEVLMSSDVVRIRLKPIDPVDFTKMQFF